MHNNQCLITHMKCFSHLNFFDTILSTMKIHKIRYQNYRKLFKFLPRTGWPCGKWDRCDRHQSLHAQTNYYNKFESKSTESNLCSRPTLYNPCRTCVHMAEPFWHPSTAVSTPHTSSPSSRLRRRCRTFVLSILL
jgi:hypothetical protein